jgi:hypothetical protein
VAPTGVDKLLVSIQTVFWGTIWEAPREIQGLNIQKLNKMTCRRFTHLTVHSSLAHFEIEPKVWFVKRRVISGEYLFFSALRLVAREGGKRLGAYLGF